MKKAAPKLRLVNEDKKTKSSTGFTGGVKGVDHPASFNFEKFDCDCLIDEFIGGYKQDEEANEFALEKM